MNIGAEESPKITRGEIYTALHQMKNKKSPGEDEITSSMMKSTGDDNSV